MISRRHVISLCAMAWKTTPDAIERRVAKRRVSLNQLVSGAIVQAMALPLTGEEVLNLAFPGRAGLIAKRARDKEISDGYESMKAERDRQRVRDAKMASRKAQKGAK